MDEDEEEEEAVITEQPKMRADVMSAVSLVPSIAPVPSTQMENAALCPHGMEYLLSTSLIIVQQQVELLEALTGYDTNNRYAVLDMSGRRMYLAAEVSSWCLHGLRTCMGSRRPFTILLLNNHGGICLKIARKCTCGFCLCSGFCCNEVHVSSADNFYLGKITQNFCDCCCPRFTIYDRENNAALTIKGPCLLSNCCSVHFSIYDMNGVEVGEIHKKWGGFVKEALTTADTFGVKFPWLMDPRLKTLLLGAVFLIDFMYFENSDNSSKGQQSGLGQMAQQY